MMIKDAITILTPSRMRLVGIPNPLTGGTMIRINDMDNNSVVVVIGLDKANTEKLGKWLIEPAEESEATNGHPG